LFSSQDRKRKTVFTQVWSYDEAPTLLNSFFFLAPHLQFPCLSIFYKNSEGSRYECMLRRLHCYLYRNRPSNVTFCCWDNVVFVASAGSIRSAASQYPSTYVSPATSATLGVPPRGVIENKDCILDELDLKLGGATCDVEYLWAEATRFPGNIFGHTSVAYRHPTSHQRVVMNIVNPKRTRLPVPDHASSCARGTAATRTRQLFIARGISVWVDGVGKE